MKKILLVEDEPNLAEITIDTLSYHGFHVLYAKNANQGAEIYRNNNPDLLIVDIMMPGKDGFSFVEEIREKNQQVPIIFLTAKSQLNHLIQGFDVGANDYIKKPFRFEELIARIKALLKFNQTSETINDTSVYKIGQYVFDAQVNELRSNTQQFQLSHKENEILKLLCKQLNQTVDSKQLLLDLWGDDNYFNAKTLNVYITKLRKYFADDPSVQIINLRSVGFKLIVRR